MLTRRSGAPSRFLVFRSAESWAMVGEFLVFNVIFGYLALTAAVCAFWSWGTEAARKVADPADPLYTLARPLSPEDVAAGAVRVSGRLAGGRVCLVTHEHFSDKSYHQDWQKLAAAGVTLAVERGEGVPAGVSLSVAWESARWEPKLWLREADDENTWRRRYPSMPSGGRVEVACVNEGDPLFADGCHDVSDHEPMVAAPIAPLRECRGRGLVLTPGDGPRIRRAELAADHAFRLSSLWHLTLIGILCGWRLLGARPIAASLVERLREARLPVFSPPALALALVTPLFLAASLWFVPRFFGVDGIADVERWGWVSLHFAAVVGVVVGLRMLDRASALGGAARLVEAGKEPPLDRLREGEGLAADVEVDRAAPLSRGPVSREDRVHHYVSVTRIYKANRNHAAEPAAPCPGPLVIPITVKGKPARLDLTHVVADLRAVRKVASPRAVKRYGEVVAQPVAGSTYVLEERFLARGEKIHVIGRVLRFEQTVGGSIPVIGGSPNEPVLVHAGSRRTLLRGLRVERAFLVVAAPIALAVTVSAAGLFVYLTR